MKYKYHLIIRLKLQVIQLVRFKYITRISYLTHSDNEGEKMNPGILRLNVVPLIFAKKTFSVKKQPGISSIPLHIFGRSDTPELICRYRELVRNLLFRLQDQERFQEI